MNAMYSPTCRSIDTLADVAMWWMRKPRKIVDTSRNGMENDARE